MPARHLAAWRLRSRATVAVLVAAALTGSSAAVIAGSAGAASASTRSVATSTAAPAKISYWASASTVRAGATVNYGAQLTSATGAPIAGVTVYFTYWTAARAVKWTLLGKAVTDASGDARIAYRLGGGVIASRASAVVPSMTLAGGARVLGGSVFSGIGRVTVIPAISAAALRIATDLRRVLALAVALRGRPYVYAGSGPYAFDCSGYTRYVYGHAAGVSLPHNAAMQYSVSTKISKSAIRPGDLVFFTSGGGIYHVAIYAGSGLIWHAPYPGTTVRLERIWTSSWVAGRVI
jgi:cell wall-associated NlpC family hydrolase